MSRGGICTIHVAKTKTLISFAVTAKLICAFVFAYAKIWFSHDAAHIKCFMLFTHVDAVSKNGLKSRCRCNTAGIIQLKGEGASGVILDTHLSFRCCIKERPEVTMLV